jgi:hypothetical protein
MTAAIRLTFYRVPLFLLLSKGSDGGQARIYL